MHFTIQFSISSNGGKQRGPWRANIKDKSRRRRGNTNGGPEHGAKTQLGGGLGCEMTRANQS